MRASLKYSYYIAVSFCALQLGVFLFASFGGIYQIIVRIKEGLYNAEFLECIEILVVKQAAQVMNTAVAIVYFASLFLCIATLIFKGKANARKYQYGLYFALIPAIILIGGILLKQLSC